MFEFYFQSGDFAASEGSLLKDFLIPFLGLGVPLWIFYEGLKKQRKEDESRKEDLEDEKLLYFYHITLGCKHFTKSFLTGMKDVIENFADNPYGYVEYRVGPSDDLVRAVERIDQEKIFHSYVSRAKSLEIRNTFDALDYINESRKQVLVLVSDWEQIDTARKKSFMEKFNPFKQEYTHYINQNKVAQPDLLSIYTEYLDVIEKDPSNLKAVNDSFLQPFLDLVNDTKQGPEVIQLHTLAITAKKSLDATAFNNTLHVKDLKELRSQVRNAVKDLYLSTVNLEVYIGNLKNKPKYNASMLSSKKNESIGNTVTWATDREARIIALLQMEEDDILITPDDITGYGLTVQEIDQYRAWFKENMAKVTR